MKKADNIGEKPVWNYNPKTAGQSKLSFGNDQTDYRTKNEVNKERTQTALTKSRKK